MQEIAHSLALSEDFSAPNIEMPVRANVLLSQTPYTSQSLKYQQLTTQQVHNLI
ncbi:Uncharacterised protein [Streptococcus pneumoniae]|nr:Uncharacterised protein [Streptococcus pneumoniae]CJH61480.1 Uncharacterised protein [Streptococcus pneumoniae]CJH92568.1 Uncharacterised protein [Streptococcus pneumoniae]CJI30859.1 Uncharacterised protein [Streptococcus pneumoniae]COK78997.1 Uncharacterised protein [Streptococcus pneumoniae]